MDRVSVPLQFLSPIISDIGPHIPDTCCIAYVDWAARKGEKAMQSHPSKTSKPFMQSTDKTQEFFFFLNRDLPTICTGIVSIGYFRERQKKNNIRK